MYKDIIKELIASNDRAKYDECAKKILANKYILAYILKGVINDYKDLTINEIISLIENVSIGEIYVDKGLTNSKITGINNESHEINEGLIRFDILFYIKEKDKNKKIIINIEAQKDMPHQYPLLNRAIYYISRLISSQKDRDFVNSNYQDMTKTYSIWILMNNKEDSLTVYHLDEHKIIGDMSLEGQLDLLNIVILGLSKNFINNDNDLYKLLGTLFSNQLTLNEKLNIINTEYSIPLENNLKEEVSTMCNLGEGLIEETAERVEKETAERVEKETTERSDRKYILKLVSLGFKPEEIASKFDIDINKVNQIINNKEG